MKLRPKIDPHDYETKKGHVVRFLKAGDKVKITIMFRGREQSRPEQGYRLLQRLAEDVADLGFIEANPRQDGRNMTMVMAPHRTVKEQAKSARPVRPTREAAPADDQPAADQPAAEPAAAAAPAPAATRPSAPRPAPTRATDTGRATTARPAAPRPAPPARSVSDDPAAATPQSATPLSARPRPVPTAPSRPRP
jgi:translation initiation factor IF-3